MEKEHIYILLEIEAKNHLLVKYLEKIGFCIDDPIYRMLETNNYGSVDDILADYFKTNQCNIYEFINNYLQSFFGQCSFKDLDGKEMYEEALEYFQTAE